MIDTELLTPERQAYIRKCLDSEGRVIASDLADTLHVSVDTIRRDLREMASAGLCRRVYGGALPPAPREAGFQARRDIMADRKIALAKAAMRVLKDGMHVFIDAGTTNLAIARAIPPDLKLTVLTNTPAIAAALVDHPACEIVLIGGQVDKETGGSVGARTVREISAFNADLAIIGTCGFSLENGLSAHTLEESEVKRMMAAQSRKAVAALTNDKLGTAANYHILDCSACETLVVEYDAPDALTRMIEKQGIHVITAEPAK